MPGSSAVAFALLAKAPRAGMAKTRLARALSPEVAAEFQRHCALSMWERLARTPARDAYFYCDVRWTEFEAVAGPGRFRLQRGRDLGERMRRCFTELLAAGYRKVLILGSDAPTLPATQIEEAEDALDAVDVVLGPAEDGGFTLIGAKRVEAAMFRGVVWSRATTRAQCLAALEAAGLRVAETPAWAYDIDTLADLRRLRREAGIPASLRRWLTAHGNLPS